MPNKKKENAIVMQLNQAVESSKHDKNTRRKPGIIIGPSRMEAHHFGSKGNKSGLD